MKLGYFKEPEYLEAPEDNFEISNESLNDDF